MAVLSVATFTTPLPRGAEGADGGLRGRRIIDRRLVDAEGVTERTDRLPSAEAEDGLVCCSIRDRPAVNWENPERERRKDGLSEAGVLSIAKCWHLSFRNAVYRQTLKSGVSSLIINHSLHTAHGSSVKPSWRAHDSGMCKTESSGSSVSAVDNAKGVVTKLLVHH